MVLRLPFLAALLRQRLRREPDAEVVTIIARVSAACRIRRRRLDFLHKVLLSHGSPFRQFIFFYGGRSGNISRTEDILDRVMSYV